jgi:hypothetical protein
MSREEQLLRRIKKLETVIETLKGGGDGEEDSTTVRAAAYACFAFLQF